AALERERGELGQLLAHASQERTARAEAEWAATAAVGTRAQQAAALVLAAAEAAEQLERARRQVAALKEQETHNRARRRQAEQAQPGPLVRLPSVPGPALAADGHPLEEGLRVDGPAAAWVRALLAGHEVLDGAGGGSRALRRANGAVFLAGRTSGKGGRSGPLQRRADLEALAQEVGEAEAVRAAATAALERTLADLAAAEAAFAAAGEASERARQHELEAGTVKGDAERAAVDAQREAADATAQVERLSTRLS